MSNVKRFRLISSVNCTNIGIVTVRYQTFPPSGTCASAGLSQTPAPWMLEGGRTSP